MLKTIGTYLRRCGLSAWKGSWNIATGFIGAVLAGLLMIYPGTIEFLSETTQQVKALNVLISFVLYTVAAWFLVSLIRFLFVSPFQLYRELMAEMETLQDELHRLVEDVEPDLAMGDAIDYIQETKETWKSAPPETIRNEIATLALRKKITVWGQPGQWNNVQRDFKDDMMGRPEKPIPIPFHFFYHVEGGLEDAGFMLERLSEYPGSEPTQYKKIYNVAVNRGQINVMFSKRKPTSTPPST
jgi:hypothetical protein